MKLERIENQKEILYLLDVIFFKICIIFDWIERRIGRNND